MPSLNQRKTIVILTAILLAVILASAAVLLLLPEGPVPAEQAALPADQSPGEVPVGTGDFNLRVLDRAGYQGLNTGLLQNGLLPVKPPANAGKANPFL